MRRTALILAGLLALTAQGQEAPDAGVEPEPEPAAQPEPTPEPTTEPTPEPTAEPTAEPAAEPAPEASFVHRVEANGYFSLRGTFSRSRAAGLIPTDDFPQLYGLAELNGQLKVSFLDRSFVYGDVSLIAQAAGSFRGVDKDGNEVSLPERDSAANRPLVSVNELYVLHEFLPELNLTLGKKRVVWGSGQAYNPTDLLNIRKDPTDPTFQRAGAWMARLEVPLETLAFTAVFAPGLLKQNSGIPQQFVTWPEWDKRDNEAHYLVALRAYALVADADVNLMFFYSNLFDDPFKDKLRFGASFSRYFFTEYEFHTEFLIGTGSGRNYVNAACVDSQLAALGCGQSNQSFISQSKLLDGSYYPKVLVGARRQFADESLLSIEYLYQADGYTPREFQDFINALELVQQARALGVPANRIPNLSGGATTDGVPSRFNFEPLVQHYLFITFMRPRIFDDFTAQLVTIANLQDLSTIWTPSISWSTTEWLTLSAIGFIPAPGLDSLSAKVKTTGQPVSEYSNLPVQYRFVIEARLFY